jgi:hypothetical protein
MSAYFLYQTIFVNTDLRSKSASSRESDFWVGKKCTDMKLLEESKKLFKIMFSVEWTANITIVDGLESKMKALGILGYIFRHFWDPFGSKTETKVDQWKRLYCHLLKLSDIDPLAHVPNLFPTLYMRCRLLMQSLCPIVFGCIDGQHRMASVIHYLLGVNPPTKQTKQLGGMHSVPSCCKDFWICDIGFVNKMLGKVSMSQSMTMVVAATKENTEQQLDSKDCRSMIAFYESVSKYYQNQASKNKARGFREHFMTAINPDKLNLDASDDGRFTLDSQ